MEHLFLLQGILESEIKAYGELLALSYQEKDAVIKNDVAQLSVVSEKQQSVLEAISKLEAGRKELFSDICAKRGVPDSSLSLQDVIDTAQGEQCITLKDLTKKLEKTAVELRRISKLNKTLINSQLKYTSLCINLIAGPQAPLGTYTGSGRVNEECADGRRLVDQAI